MAKSTFFERLAQAGGEQFEREARTMQGLSDAGESFASSLSEAQRGQFEREAEARGVMAGDLAGAVKTALPVPEASFIQEETLEPADRGVVPEPPAHIPEASIEEYNDGIAQVVETSGTGVGWSRNGRQVYYDAGEVKVPETSSDFERHTQLVASHIEKAKRNGKPISGEMMDSFTRSMEKAIDHAVNKEHWTEPAKRARLDKINSILGDIAEDQLGVRSSNVDISKAMFEAYQERLEGLPDGEGAEPSVTRTELADAQDQAKLSQALQDSHAANGGDPILVVEDLVEDAGLLNGVQTKQDALRIIQGVVQEVDAMNQVAEQMAVAEDIRIETDAENAVVENVVQNMADIVRKTASWSNATGKDKFERGKEVVRAMTAGQVKNLDMLSRFGTEEELAEFRGHPTAKSQSDLARAATSLRETGGFETKGQRDGFVDALSRELRAGGSAQPFIDFEEQVRNSAYEKAVKELEDSLPEGEVPSEDDLNSLRQNTESELATAINQAIHQAQNPSIVGKSYDIDTPEEEAVVASNIMAGVKYLAVNDENIKSRMFRAFQRGEEPEGIFNSFFIDTIAEFGSMVTDEESAGFNRVLSNLVVASQMGKESPYPQINEVRNILYSQFQDGAIAIAREQEIKARQDQVEQIQKAEVGARDFMHNVSMGLAPKGLRVGRQERVAGKQGRTFVPSLSPVELGVDDVVALEGAYMAQYAGRITPDSDAAYREAFAKMKVDALLRADREFGFNATEEQMQNFLGGIGPDSDVGDIKKLAKDTGVELARGDAKKIVEELETQPGEVEVRKD